MIGVFGWVTELEFFAGGLAEFSELLSGDAFVDLNFPADGAKDEIFADGAGESWSGVEEFEHLTEDLLSGGDGIGTGPFDD